MGTIRWRPNFRVGAFGWALAPDRRTIFVGGSSRIATGKELQVFEGHSDEVRSATFSPDGRWAISASLDGTLRLWALP